MNPKKSNIILIGMSGAGKSTLGVLLAKALGMDFTDTDILIQRRCGKKLQEIIDSQGAEAFLRSEEKVLTELSAENCVVATGGSAVYSRAGMAALAKNGTVVYLHVDFAELKKRVRNITTRGIVMLSGGGFEELYEERRPLYERYADLVVECTGATVEESVSKIISALE